VGNELDHDVHAIMIEDGSRCRHIRKLANSLPTQPHEKSRSDKDIEMD
jgi:hypothetical protein